MPTLSYVNRLPDSPTLETPIYINQALEQTAGNKNQAANLLGLNRTTLVEKLKRGFPELLAASA